MYTDFTSSLNLRPLLPTSTSSDSEIYNCVIHPYNATAFSKLLETCSLTEQFPLLVDNLNNGFPIGNLPPLTETVIIDNHPLVYKHLDTVYEYIDTELQEGHMSGPFSQDEMERILRGPFYCSPFIVSIEEQGEGLPPKKPRVCRNLSKGSPTADSVNSLINKEDFPTLFDMPARVADAVSNFIHIHVLVGLRPPSLSSSWALLSSGFAIPLGLGNSQPINLSSPLPHLTSLTSPHQIASSPDGTQACAFDIKAFHCTCPVHPAYKPWLVVCVPRGFYIDHCHPFGLCPASSNSGQIANAVIAIWAVICPGLESLKFEDDMSVLRMHALLGAFSEGVFTYSFDRDSCMELIACLGVPWHPAKTGLRFAFEMIFIGFFWDLARRRVSLPDPKRLKFLLRVSSLLRRIDRHESIQLLDLQIIHGSLVYICFVYVAGSSRLPPISNFMAQFHGNTFIWRLASHSVQKSLKWWQEQLSIPSVFRLLSPLQPLQDLGIYVDTSTDWGISIIIGEKWYAFRLVSGWKTPGIDIGWLEAVALKLLM